MHLIGKRISIPGQFTGSVTVESIAVVDDTVLLQVRTQQGELREALLSNSDIEEILTHQQQTSAATVDANSFFLFIESARIKTAFAYDPHFAVSLSGVRPLPHQLEAVYERILPQVRLRFLLSAVFLDADAQQPYSIHFFEVQVAGVGRQGKDKVLKAQLCAVAEKSTGELALISPDCLHNLAPVVTDELKVGITDQASATSALNTVATPTPQEQQKVENWLKVKVQLPLMNQERSQRQRELQIRQDYLKQAMESAIRDAQLTQMKLASKVAAGDETYRVARDSAQNKVRDLQERYKNKQGELDYLKIIRPGRVAYLGTALVHPAPVESKYPGMQNDPEVEAFAMQYVMDYERQRGWEPEDVSKNQDGSGFDIRSVGPVDPPQPPLNKGGQIEPPSIRGDGAMSGDKPLRVYAPVRRIEVKGRAQLYQQVSLTVNEWRKAQQLGDSYWLYVVWGCQTESPQLLMIQNPAKALAGDAKEIKQVTRYIVAAEALQQCALRGAVSAP